MHFPLKKFFDVCDVNIFAIIAQVYFSIFAKIIIFNVALHKKTDDEDDVNHTIYY